MSVRPPRADAQRNRELLLRAASDEFAERGPDASVADIARRAGVAKGTVFRHFASKEHLIAAIVADHIRALVAAAREQRDAADPGEGLLAFLTVAADRRRQRDITALLAISAADDTVARIRDELLAEIAYLVERAQSSGDLRTDVTTNDVFLLICAPVHVVENLPGAPDDLWRRYLGIVFDGLRPAGASPLPRPAPEFA